MSNSNSVLWIILRKSEKPDGNTEFQQDGPYSTEEIQELLGRGLLRATDFVWKKGADAWIPVTDVDDFNLFNLKEQATSKDDFKKVVEFETGPQHFVGQSMPPPDTFSRFFNFGVARFKWIYFIPIALLAVFGIYKAIAKSSHRNPPPVEIAKVDAAPVAPLPPPPAAPAVKAPASAAEQTTPAAIPNKFAVKVLGRDFQIIGPFELGQKIEVTLKGKTGDVLEVPALYLKFQTTAKKTGEILVSHKNYQIPQGKFDLSVTNTTGKEGHFKITLSDSDADLEKSLKKHRKKIAFDLQSEKRNFIRYVEKLEKQPALAKNAKLAPKELQWVLQDRNYLVFRSDWLRLQKLLDSNSRAPASVSKDRDRNLKKLKAEVQLKSSSSNPN